MQIDIAIEMEYMIKKINQSEKRNLANSNLERIIKFINKLGGNQNGKGN